MSQAHGIGPSGEIVGLSQLAGGFWPSASAGAAAIQSPDVAAR